MPLVYGKPMDPMEKYSKYWSHCAGDKKYLLEASPSYIYGKEVIARRILHELGPDVRVIFIFRNPADRLFSFYERKKVNTYLSSGITFRQFVEKSISASSTLMDEHRDDEEALFERGIREGCYIDYLPPWFDTFGDRLRILFFEDLKANATDFMRDVCHWLELDFGIYSPDDFKIENQTIAYRNRWLHKTMLETNKRFESFWRKNVGLKRALRSLYKKVNAAEAGRERMSADDRAFLDELYQPYNKRLAEFLRGKGMTALPDWLK
jgi:hypothetical protein